MVGTEVPEPSASADENEEALPGVWLADNRTEWIIRYASSDWELLT